MHAEVSENRLLPGTAISFAPGRRTDSTAPAPSLSPAPTDKQSGVVRLLWIDDEISLDAMEIRFLRAQGFSVDCAVSGRDGLAKVHAGQYQLIVLDLKLPDLPGLSVLATLRAERIATPVLVLTGFGDLESARIAGFFGAAGFKAKPLFVDELEMEVRRLAANASATDRTKATPHTGDDAASDELGVGLAAIASLLERLDTLSGSTESQELSAEDLSSAGAPSQQLAATLITAVANPGLPMAAFLACAASLRHFNDAGKAASARELAGAARDLIHDALAKPEVADSRVAAALDAACSAAAAQTRLMIETIAGSLNISESNLSRLVKEETGFNFTEWRTAFLLRPSLRPLVGTSEQVKQIACTQLGFTHESQFDREFQRFFSISPTRFRELGRRPK